MKKMILRYFPYWLNALEIMGVIGILLTATFFQLFAQEIPCPLCLLQRIGFFGIALGILMNFKFGIHAGHYAICILSAIFTSIVALRQTLLHIIPGTGTYGGTFLGYHFYTLSFAISIIYIVVFAISIMIGLGRRLTPYHKRPRWQKLMINTFFIILFGLIVLHIYTTFLECGLGICPENPTGYKY